MSEENLSAKERMIRVIGYRFETGEIREEF
jgi:hypothetical protein